MALKLWTLAVFAIGSSGLASFAAPVPKESKAHDFAELFGKPEDPSKQGEFKLDGKQLVLTVPDGSKAGFPRTNKEVVGDFEMEVKLLCKSPEGTISGTAGAGLVLWNGESDLVLVERSHWFDKRDQWTSGVNLLMQAQKRNVVSSTTVFGGDASTNPVKLRLRREEGVVTTWVNNSKEDRWHKLHERKFELATAVNVGVFAHSKLSAKFEVTFEALSITPIAKK